MRPFVFFFIIVFFFACKKGNGDSTPTPSPPPSTFGFNSVKVNSISSGFNYNGINRQPSIRLSFTNALDRSTAGSSVVFVEKGSAAVPFNSSFSAGDSVITIQPSSLLQPLTKYTVTVNTTLKSKAGGQLQTAVVMNLLTAIDSSDKFPVISDTALLTLVQQQTFKYFWDAAHPVSGLARERANSGETVTTGGSGFGVMAIITGIHRGFISRAQGLARLQTITGFLKNTAQKFHGAFPHWMNGTTGAVIPFSAKDNGADLVETSFLIEGLLCARQYFNGGDAAETALRADINSIWNAVEWNWFRNNQNVLYWHWSPNFSWDMNVPIRGWNEALITYVLAASSASFSIPKTVYDEGWARNGNIKNLSTYYGYTLPLGPVLGGPLFFEHYSFMGINPNGLVDAYANYSTQTVNHTRINYEFCKANPNGQYGYSDQCWGLTASDIPGGYSASSPTNDLGVIAPTAALSSLPYTPAESMKALRFFYYKLGDKLWGPYGFYDAFSMKEAWFSNSYLAIDQGPIIVMTENYRSGLLWNLFTSCPEIKSGMQSLGFTAPWL